MYGIKTNYCNKNMNNKISISNQIFDELLTTVESIGVERTIKTLQEAKSNSLILKDMNVEFMLDTVSQVTQVNRDRIINGKERTDERKIAVALCVYFIKNEFGYSYSDLNKIFKKDDSQLFRYSEMVKNKPLKPKTEFDKTLDSYYKKINLLITEKKLHDGK